MRTDGKDELEQDGKWGKREKQVGGKVAATYNEHDPEPSE